MLPKRIFFNCSTSKFRKIFLFHNRFRNFWRICFACLTNTVSELVCINGISTRVLTTPFELGSQFLKFFEIQCS